MGMKQLLKRELWQIFVVDKRRAAFLFGAALAYFLIFGALYMPNIVKYIPLVICDEENSQLSRDLIRSFSDSDSFTIVGYTSSQEEMQESLREKEAYAAVQIPRDFSRKIKNGDTTPVLFMVNGSNIVITNIASSAAQDIVTAFSDRLASLNASLRLGADAKLLYGRIAPIDCHLRVLHNPTQGYMLFFLLGLAMAAFQQGIIFAVGASVHYEYDNVPDAASWRLLLVKLVVYWVLALLSLGMVVAIAQGIFSIALKAPYWQVFALGGAFSFAIISFCLLAASLFNNEKQFIRAAVLYPVPAFIFSGYTWPRASMDGLMQVLSCLFPISWLSDAVRSLFTAGMIPHLGGNICILLVLGAVFLAAAVKIFPRQLARRIEFKH